MSRNLNVGSALLFIIGILGVFFGLYYTLLPSSVLLSNEDLLGMTVTELHNFSPKVVDTLEHYLQLFGVYALSFALSLCVISLIPYRKGEKWAWYAILVIFGIAMLGTLTLFAKTNRAITLSLILVILWIVGLALPAKEILGKPS